MRQSILALALGLTLTSGANAGVFDQADALFANRANGLAAVAAARAEYVRLSSGATGSNLAYVVQQIGRLAIYEGLYLLPNTSAQNARRTAIFNECRQLAGRLADQAPYVNQYSYWRATCNGLWIKYAPIQDRLFQVPEIKRNFNQLAGDDLEIKPELGIDQRYQSGGLPRTLAGIYSHGLSSLLRDGLPNQDKALVMIDRAMRSQAFPGDSTRGDSFYSNHRIKAEVLVAREDQAGARALLEQAIEEINELEAGGDLPAGIEPETLGERALMQSMLDAL